ncbi:MAG: SAM-dependent chlorinase/fluorinase [Actinobacteria bacterium]|nr:SAM-dependent chlorinase/fluorinase [Actinomycetota bacterium]
MSGTRAIVFMTDYGLDDEFVGVCRGVIARIVPDARVIDLTHAIPRQDVLRGAVVLARAVRYMPEGAVYLAVVDPTVGSGRRAVAVSVGSGASLVGPDNGVLSMAWEELGGAGAAVEITSERVLLRPVSRTFHGRDIFAPAAANLAAGLALEELGPTVPVGDLRRVMFPAPKVQPGRIEAAVTGVDGFGNVQLSARPSDLEAAGLREFFRVEHHFVRVASAFADVSEGDLAAIEDSQGYVALAVNRGSAAEALGVREGSVLTLE